MAKKNEISAILDYLKSEIAINYNYIKEIVSKDDRTSTDKMIDSVRNAKGISASDADQISRVLTYYKHLTDGMSFEYGIVFFNGDIWNVEYTGSLRSDRVEGLINRVTKCPAEHYYVVVGDFEKTDKFKKRQYKKNRQNVCIVSLEEFVDDVLYEIYSYNAKGTHRWKLSEAPMSKINGLRGPMWEKCIAHCLSTRGAFLPNHYKMIMSEIEVDNNFTESDVQSVVAKAIGTKRGKSDIEVKIQLLARPLLSINISMKASSQDKVSLHQAKAKDFVTNLGMSPQSKEAQAIMAFGKSGNMQTMTTNQKKDLINYFSQPANYSALVKWAFQGPSGKIDYFLLHSYEQDDFQCRKNTKIFGTANYMRVVKSISRQCGFGTGLEWTKNGSDIQLKVPFVFD